ncbi:MAG: hypothetical protein M1820_004915 [Bogoriella megaspora]|nr:MAG: hypothetical protein M1820_004915 [Bogoriella megaspora]
MDRDHETAQDQNDGLHLRQSKTSCPDYPSYTEDPFVRLPPEHWQHDLDYPPKVDGKTRNYPKYISKTNNNTHGGITPPKTPVKDCDSSAKGYKSSNATPGSLSHTRSIETLRRTNDSQLSLVSIAEKYAPRNWAPDDPLRFEEILPIYAYENNPDKLSWTSIILGFSMTVVSVSVMSFTMWMFWKGHW